jgi:hypothetical protein
VLNNIFIPQLFRGAAGAFIPFVAKPFLVATRTFLVRLWLFRISKQGCLGKVKALHGLNWNSEAKLYKLSRRTWMFSVDFYS